MWVRANYLNGAVMRRERAHRRGILAGMGALIVLSAGPLFGHHLSGAFERMMDGTDHLGALCLVALHRLLAPVHEGFHLLLAAGLLFALWDRARAWRVTHRILARLSWRSPTVGDAIWTAGARVGVATGQLRVVDGLPTPAFTVGLLRPVVYVASDLAMRFEARELAAVLAHEGAHAARRDPLRLSLMRFLACTLFWLPAMRRLADDLADEAEIAADDAAASLSLPSAPLTLACALVAAAESFGSRAASVEGADIAPFCPRRPDLLGRRVLRLAGEDAPIRSRVGRGSVALAAVTLLLVWTSSIAVAHPLPQGVAAHCAHDHVSSFAHLFCRAHAEGLDGCPHTER